MVIVEDFPIGLQAILFELDEDEEFMDTSIYAVSMFDALKKHPFIFWDELVLESMPAQLYVQYCPNDISREQVIAFMSTYKCTVQDY